MYRKIVVSTGSALFLSLVALLAVAPPARGSDTLTLLLFGRESFDRSASPYARTFAVPSTQGTFSMNLINGDGAGNDPISSAIIKVNGTTGVAPVW